MCSKNTFLRSFFEKNWFFRFPNLKGLKFGDSQSTSHKINISGLKLPINHNYKPGFIRFGTFFRNFDGLDAKEKSIKFFTKKVSFKKKKKLNIAYFLQYFYYFNNFIKILKKAFLKIFIYRFFYKNSFKKGKSDNLNLNIIHADKNDKRRFCAKKPMTMNKNLVKKVLHNLFSKKIIALKMNTLMNLSHRTKINKEKNKIIKRKEKKRKHKTNLNPIISKKNLNGLKRKSISSKNKIFFSISYKLDKMKNQKKKNISTSSSKKKFFWMKTNYFFFIKKFFPNNFSKLIFNRNILFIHIENNNNNKQKWVIFFKKKCLKFLKNNNKKRNHMKKINNRRLKYLGLIENSKKQPAIDLDCPFSFLVCISNKNITINKIKGIIITKKLFKEKSNVNKILDKKINHAKKFVKNLILNITAIENFEKKNFESQNEEFFLFLKNTYFFYDITFKNFKKFFKILIEDNLNINLLKKKNSKSRIKLMTLNNPIEEFTFSKKSKFLSELIIKFFKWKNLEEKNHDFSNLLETPDKVKITLNLKKISHFKKHCQQKHVKNHKKKFYPKNHKKNFSILKGFFLKKKKELKYENLKKKKLIGNFFHLPFRLKFKLKKHDKLEKTIRELDTVAIFLKSLNKIKPNVYKNENVNYNNSLNTIILDLIQGSPSKKYTKRFPILTKNYDSINRIGYCIEFQHYHSIFFLSQNINFSDIIQIKTEIKPKNKNKECKINICPEQNSKSIDFGFLHYVFSNFKKNKLIKKNPTNQLLNFKNNIKLEKLINRIGEFKKKSHIFDFSKYKKKYILKKKELSPKRLFR